ncbi:MAG: hypothetical protein CV087_05555 [Candidatus Brocadia sp. WS118]|nr:MAG: hypothetical protein CV087_05555 [Candidatus Brocadia sp. WS118]
MSKRTLRKRKPAYTGLGARELIDFSDFLRKKKFSPKTVEIRERVIVDLFWYLRARGLDRLADVQLSDLDDYRAHIMDRGFNINSVNSYLWSIRKFFEFLDESQLIFHNPAHSLLIPRPNRRMQPVPTEQEMKQLLSVPDVLTPVGVRDRAILEVMYASGVRRGELLGMKIFDPDFERGMIRVVGKGRKERVVPLGKHALYWLKEYIKDSWNKLVKTRVDTHALWVSKDGTAVSGVRVDQMIRGYVKKAGIVKSISAHSLRRACATHMLMNGAHPVQLQMLLGHASLESLSQYLQIGIRELMQTHHKTRLGR